MSTVENATTSSTSTTSTTTPKPIPCEIPKKTNEKSAEKTEEKLKVTTTTVKPFFTKISKRRRRSARNPCGSKRCIGDIFGLSSDQVAASNLNDGDSDRYEPGNKLAASKDSDNLAEESELQAMPVQTDLFGNVQINSGSKRVNLFAKLPSHAKTDNLIHGNLPNIIESNENHRQLLSNGFDSSQSNFRSSIQPMIKPETSNYEFPSSHDYLPSHEFFPTNSNDFQVSPSNVNSNHPNKFVIGPTAFKTNPLYEATLGDVAESESDQEVTAILPHHESSVGCRCDPEQFNELLRHMQSSYKEFHNGMMQLFDTFKSQANCGPNPVMTDSTSSHSQPRISYQAGCFDRHNMNADDKLTLKCPQSSADSSVNPSSGFYTPPGVEITKPTGFKNQFLTYSDYIRMVQNVNANPGTVLSHSYELNEDLNGSSQFTSLQDQRDHTTNQLKQHLQNIQQQEQFVAEPELVKEEPKLSIEAKPEATAKFPLKLKIESFLEKLKKP